MAGGTPPLIHLPLPFNPSWPHNSATSISKTGASSCTYLKGLGSQFEKVESLPAEKTYPQSPLGFFWLCFLCGKIWVDSFLLGGKGWIIRCFGCGFDCYVQKFLEKEQRDECGDRVWISWCPLLPKKSSSNLISSLPLLVIFRGDFFGEKKCQNGDVPRRRSFLKGGDQWSPAKKVSPKAPWNTAAKKNVKVTLDLDQVVPFIEVCVFTFFCKPHQNPCSHLELSL